MGEQPEALVRPCQLQPTLMFSHQASTNRHRKKIASSLPVLVEKTIDR